MKRSTKLSLGGLTLLLGAVVLTGCTASYCRPIDKANILYAMDYGVTNYVSEGEAQEVIKIKFNSEEITLENVYGKVSTEFASTIVFDTDSSSSVISTLTKSGIAAPSITYWAELDNVLLEEAIKEAYKDKANGNVKVNNLPENPKDLTAYQIRRPFDNYQDYERGILDVYGYLKFSGENEEGETVLWERQTAWENAIRAKIGPDFCPTSDFTKGYRAQMEQKIATYRSCLATADGEYGAYGDHKIPVPIEGKGWTDWNGLMEFLLVWPIGALIDVLTNGLMGAGNGVAQLLAIFFVTIIVRSIMLIFTFKQQRSTAKMNELQPEIQKIQAKYPNANTNNYEKQRLGQEMQKLYKKHNINPFTSILVMFIQFPVFICVWGAMQGSAALSSGQFLGLRLSDSISGTLFNASEWAPGGGAVTALILFILMSAAQVVSMLLPQWIQKRRAKNFAKLGKNPAKKAQDNKMKWFTYIMMAMIIFMGFSLASGMGVYWLVGALFSIAQTLITNAITTYKQNKKGNN